jgi:TonB family protein
MKRVIKRRAIIIATFAVAFAPLCVSQLLNAPPTTSPRPHASSLDDFRAGEQSMAKHDYQNAANLFQSALNGDGQPAWTVVWSHIDLGRAFDLTGQRDRARTQYQSAINTNDDTFGAQGIAKAALLTPLEPDLTPLPQDVEVYVQPKILTKAEPQYTQEALLARLEGTVTVETSVGADGRILDVRARTSLGLGLDEAAVNAVRQWTFSPATRQGSPIPDVAYVEVNFGLPALPGWHVKKIEFAPPTRSARPTLTTGTRYIPDKMPPDLAEEAGIDTAMRRVPDASISMDIDTSGAPTNVQVVSASLPGWGDDAVRAIGEWRFSSGAAVTPCTIELAWFPSK